VGQLGANAHGEVLEAGRVEDCYLGLRLDPDDDARATGALVVASAALLHPVVPQPDGTGAVRAVDRHLDPTPGQLVFLADLTLEAAGLADRHLGQGWRRPAGGRRRGGRRLARRAPQGALTGWG
jgi:hypothetical protein